MDPASSLKCLLGIAWLLPLASFALIVLFGSKMGPRGRYAGHLATIAIVTSCGLSLISLFGFWLPSHPAREYHVEQAPRDAIHVQTVSNAVSTAVLTGHAPVMVSQEGGVGSGHDHDAEHTQAAPRYYAGEWYTLGQFGKLKITIGYYIDSLTVVMFVMVCFISSCIHFYSMGYMHEELDEVTDHEVTLSSGEHLRRRGRYHRFFQYMSLFCFSMLGVIIAGNMAMVFVFWELVGICSYFLIGFYFERKSASTAANKAFIVNRVGDFGMIIGLMVLWAGLGTFAFGDRQDADGQVVVDADGHATEPGIFSQLRAGHNNFSLKTPDKMVRGALLGKKAEVTRYFLPQWPEYSFAWPEEKKDAAVEHWVLGLKDWRQERRAWIQENQAWIDDHQVWIERTRTSLSIPPIPEELRGWSANEKRVWLESNLWRVDKALEGAITAIFDDELHLWRDGRAVGDPTPYGYWLLVVAGLGIFCGCVGKSAQFPLHVWLPDAMEGPTPVSALVHSATMVAAGVYLVGRFYPVFTPEVLLMIAYIGGITLFIAATIAVTATDIKRVLAYSTVSQLGYMMLALGVGGWLAGMFHLVTHAFFKSLLFMCSGSVIHAVHTNEMPEMGGLRKKMPITAYTMLVGCLAIIGASVPFVVGLSGYYSKDAILEQAWLFSGGFAERAIDGNPLHSILFFVAAGGAAITAFYMFRLWYMTFAGEPRNADRYDHAHESPRVMWAPLVVLAVMATMLAWTPTEALGVALLLFVVGALLFVRHLLTGEKLAPDSRSQSQRIWATVMIAAVGLAIVGIIWRNVDVSLVGLLEQGRPAGTLDTSSGGLLLTELTHPMEHLGHENAIKVPVTMIAFATALGGFLLATVMYCWKLLDPQEVRQQFRPIYRFLLNKWWFDELYNALIVQPSLFLARRVAQLDLRVIDGIIHAIAALTRWIARVGDAIIDRRLVDGSVNVLAQKTWDVGLSLRHVQTGKLRQYVMFIVVGTVALFLLIAFVRSYATAGW